LCRDVLFFAITGKASLELREARMRID